MFRRIYEDKKIATTLDRMVSSIEAIERRYDEVDPRYVIKAIERTIEEIADYLYTKYSLDTISAYEKASTIVYDAYERAFGTTPIVGEVTIYSVGCIGNCPKDPYDLETGVYLEPEKYEGVFRRLDL